MFNLGILAEDIFLRKKEDFELPGVDRKLGQVRYNHHRKSVMDLVNEVIKERHRLKVEEMIKKSRENKLSQTGFPRSPDPKMMHQPNQAGKHEIVRHTRNVNMSSEDLF